MKLSFKLTTCLILFVCSVAFAHADNVFPSFPMAFWGNATIDNQPAAIGTKIEAYCNDLLIGEVTILENGIYGYNDSTKNKLLISNCNSDIVFEYLLPSNSAPSTGSNTIKYADGFQSSVTKNQDLNFTNTQSCNITNGYGNKTWNGSGWGTCNLTSCYSGYTQNGNYCSANAPASSGGGGGGGGGGSPVITQSQSTTTQQVTITQQTPTGTSSASILPQVKNTGSTASSYKIGDTGPNIKALQILLNELGYNVTKSGEETNYFGPKTKAALTLLQKDIDSGDFIIRLLSLQSGGQNKPVTKETNTVANQNAVTTNKTASRFTFKRKLSKRYVYRYSY